MVQRYKVQGTSQCSRIGARADGANSIFEDPEGARKEVNLTKI